MSAAIEGRRTGAGVALVTKASLGRDSATSRALMFGVIPGDRPANLPGYDPKPGKYIEDQTLVRTLAQEGFPQIQNLISLGVPMLKVEPDSKYDTFAKWRPQGSEFTHGGALVLDA